MIAVFTVISAAGCQATQLGTSTASPVAQTGNVQQLIVKFRPGVTACDAAGIARIGAASKVVLDFVRPMSGDACIVRLSSDSPEGLLAGQRKLKNHPAIEWLEVDRVMRAF